MRNMRRSHQFMMALALAVGGTGWAHADFIPISGPASGELGHAAILEGVFSSGTAWTSFGRQDSTGRPVDWTNGTLTAWRVDDWGVGTTLDVNTAGAGDDQHWTGGPVQATARARYAGYAQELGYRVDGGDGYWEKLFAVTGSGLKVTGAAELDLAPGQTWTWVRAGSGLTWYSDPTLNADQKEHLVTYRLTGLNDGQNHWLLFWEDYRCLGDKDYNDLMVEVTAPVPEPATLLLMALGYAWSRRRSG